MIKYILLIISVLFFSTPLYALQTCISNINETTPDSRFSINGGEVTDNQTGLIWQKCSLGLSGSDCRTGSVHTYTWSGALQAAQSAGGDWRLPNVKELLSIIEQKCDSPSINLSIFPATISDVYWSASPRSLSENTLKYREQPS